MSKKETKLDSADESPDDPHYFRINGRAWRRTDPAIPKPLLSQLTKELMSARRAVKAALKVGDKESLKIARDRVNDAKIALGERGHRWWEPASVRAHEHRIAAAIRALLRQRDIGKTVCPSEAARVAGAADWRQIMPIAVEVSWALEKTKWLEVTQGGVRVERPTTGPIRLRRKPEAS